MTGSKSTIAEILKKYPDLKITIDPSLDKDKGIGNPKKLADMKSILSKVKFPLPTR